MFIEKFCIFSLTFVPGKKNPDFFMAHLGSHLISNTSFPFPSITFWEHERLSVSIKLYSILFLLWRNVIHVFGSTVLCVFSSQLDNEVMRKEVGSVWLCSPISGLTFAEQSLEEVEHHFYIYIQQSEVGNMDIMFYLLGCSCFLQLYQQMVPRRWNELWTRSLSPH